MTFALGFLSRQFFKMAITGHELFKLETKMLVGGNNRHSNIEKKTNRKICGGKSHYFVKIK